MDTQETTTARHDLETLLEFAREQRRKLCDGRNEPGGKHSEIETAIALTNLFIKLHTALAELAGEEGDDGEMTQEDIAILSEFLRQQNT
jgi:hypothetical protein